MLLDSSNTDHVMIPYLVVRLEAIHTATMPILSTMMMVVVMMVVAVLALSLLLQ